MIYLLLSSNSLEIITSSGTQTINFPTDIVKYQEIINKDLFKKILIEFFAKSKKHEAIIFVDSNLVYKKIINTTGLSKTDLELKAESFFSSVPFSEGNSANLVVRNKSEVAFASTNKNFLILLHSILTNMGWKIKFIAPLSIFLENTNTTITYSLLKKLGKQKKLMKEFNFLPSLQDEKPHEEKLIDKKMIFLIILMLMSFSALGITLFLQFGNTSKDSAKPVPSVTVTISPTIESVSPTSSVSASLSKKDIKIQIFNGSGTPGEASNVENTLINLGFINIEVGDAEGAESNTTIVIFSERTPKEYKDEILNELKKTFDNIETQEISTSDSYDVFITTGINNQ